MSNIVKLVSSQTKPKVTACGTCRHFRLSSYGQSSHGCRAVATYADMARQGECRNGALWEAKPPRRPLLIAIKEWLIG